VKRRWFIKIVGGAALAWPLPAGAQQKPMRVIGLLSAFSPTPTGDPQPQQLQALKEAGYVVGENIAFEYRFAEAHYDRLPEMAADLVGRQVSLISAIGLPAARAAKAATTTIPIVFWSGGDPVADGLVGSLNYPGGNLTGAGTFNNALGAKRLELLQELVPKGASFAILVNPTGPSSEAQSDDAQKAGNAKGLQVRVIKASSDAEIEAAFATLIDPRADGLMVASDPYLYSRRDRLVALAAQYAVPTVYTVRNYAVAGGLITYTSNSDMSYERGNYIGRILNGEKPRVLPIQQPTKFEMAINLKTAKALGLTVPPSLLARADEIIE
jgi:putative ABC transport system substrate-binding protein